MYTLMMVDNQVPWSHVINSNEKASIGWSYYQSFDQIVNMMKLIDQNDKQTYMNRKETEKKQKILLFHQFLVSRSFSYFQS